MSIDVLGIRDQTLAHVAEVYQSFTLLEGAGVALGVILFLGAFEWHRRYVKGKGFRMAVEHERQRIKRLMSDGITDLILGLETNGKISTQQGDKLYAEISKQLDLPDLIPTKRRAKIVKNEIKSRLKSTKHQFKKPEVPGKPEPIARWKFRAVVGNVSKFFSKA